MLSNRWLILAVFFATRTTIAYQFQSIASVGPLLMDGLTIGFATLGALIGCYMLPGIVLALPGGLLNQRFGARRTLLLGLVLMSAGGLAAAAAPAVPILFAGRIVSGAGAAILNVVLARTVAIWFAKDDLPFVMGTFVASWPLGVALSLISIPTFAIASGWVTALAIASVPPIACGLVLAAFYRDPIGADPAPTGLRFNLSQREFLLASLAGGIWGFYNAAYIIFVASIPEFLVHHGLSLIDASNLASVFGWVLIVSLPLGGYVTRRLDCSNWMMGFCFLWIAIAALGLASSSETMLSLTLLVLIVGLPAGAILAILPNALHVDRLAIGMGIFFTIFYIALAALPGVAGFTRSQSGDVSSPILFGAGSIMIAFLLLLILVRLSSPDSSRRSLGGR